MHKAISCGIRGATFCLLPLFISYLTICSVVLLTNCPLAVAQVDGEEEALEARDAAPVDRGGDEEIPEPETILSMGVRALGWLYSVTFLALSFILVALCVMIAIMARRENVIPSRLVTQFEAHLNAKRYQEAYELARTDVSFLGRVLSAGLAKLSTAGYGEAIEAMQEVGEDENMKLEHQLSYVALIGAISPMVGLFGTVHGMIMSFQVIATSPTQPSPQKLADGIMTALWTTLVGLFLAIPAIAAHNFLRNRINRMVLETGIVSEGLMSRFKNMTVRRPPAGPVEPPQPMQTPQPSPQQQTQ